MEESGGDLRQWRPEALQSHPVTWTRDWTDGWLAVGPASAMDVRVVAASWRVGITVIHGRRKI